LRFDTDSACSRKNRPGPVSALPWRRITPKFPKRGHPKLNNLQIGMHK
jgi:hypothetical protein